MCGWDVSFEDLKYIAEWQYVNGVNMLCQHLAGYTLRGFRKRDYPASLNYHQSWWREYTVFNDYISRLGLLLSEGTERADVLLLHRMKSGWITFNNQNEDRLDKLDSDFAEITCLLADNHISHHYGDETIIAKHGMVADGKFTVGRCAYTAVVLPSMITVDATTLDLLNMFMDNGGKVFSVGDVPKMINGDSGNKAEFDNALVKTDIGNLVAGLEEKNIRDIAITQKGSEIADIHIQQRDIGGLRLYYMVNLSKTSSYSATVMIKGLGEVCELDLAENECRSLKSECKGKSTVAEIEFLPMQSKVIIMGEHERENSWAERKRKISVKPGDHWDIEAVRYNSITLDSCAYRIDGGPEQEKLAVKLMDKLMKMKRKCSISLEFTFDIGMNLDICEEMLLAMECPTRYKISVNGNSVAYDGAGWWKDSSIKTINIKEHVKLGSNRITLEGEFYQRQKVYDVLFGENILETEINKLTYDTELESIYIIGGFGVKTTSGYSYGERNAMFTEGPFVLCDMPKSINTGSITEQGFCFLSEAVTLSQNMRISKPENTDVILDIGKPNAAVTEVFVNDKPVKTIAWQPYTVDITDYVTDGMNKIMLKLYPGNRNLLGPHHNIQGELYYVGPISFTDKPGWPRRESNEYWRDSYCFVKFGLEKS